MYDYQITADAYRQLHGIKEGEQEITTPADFDELYEGLAESMKQKPGVWH